MRSQGHRSGRAADLAAALVAAACGGIAYGIYGALLAALRGHPNPLVHLATGIALFGASATLAYFACRLAFRRRSGAVLPVALVAAGATAAEVFFQGHLRFASREPWWSVNHAFSLAAALGSATLVLLFARAWSRSRAARAIRRGIERRPRLFAAAAALLIAACTPVAWDALLGRPRPPLGDAGLSARARFNVLFITIDTLRQDHLTQYGYQRDTSSRLDRFGFVRFDHAVAAANWTKPTTASMLTGTYPTVHNATEYESVLPPEALTVTEIARGLGMATGYVTANVNASGVFGMDQGAQFSSGDPTDPPHALAGTTLGDLLRREVLRLDRARHLNRLAHGFLDAARGRRFFLYVHYNDPHTPYDPEAWRLDEEARAYEGRVLLRPPLDGRVTAEERAHMIARYDAEIEGAVDAAADLLKRLEREGALDDTLVILTADHGEAFDDHGLWSHGNSTYEVLVRIPLLIRPPGGAGAAPVVRAPVSQVDLLPTVLDYWDARAPDHVSGRTLRPLLEGVAADAERTVLTECHWNGQWGVRDRRYKVIVSEEPEERLEMYAPLDDPAETRDLSALPEFAPIATELLSRGESLRSRLLENRLLDVRRGVDERLRRELTELGYVR